MFYKKILLISLLLITSYQFSLVTIVNHTPWPELFFFENKRAKVIGKIILKPKEGICFGKYSHPILNKTFTIRRKLRIWDIPQDSNPGAPESLILTKREEQLTDASDIDYATASYLTIITPINAEFQGNISLEPLNTKTSFTRQHKAKYIDLDRHIIPIL